MGIQERKTREKEELRQLILTEAARVFIEEGFQKTSMRTRLPKTIPGPLFNF